MCDENEFFVKYITITYKGYCLVDLNIHLRNFCYFFWLTGEIWVNLYKEEIKIK